MGLPIPGLESRGRRRLRCCSWKEGTAPRLGNLAEALTVPSSDPRLFGKPDLAGRRRLGVALALGTSVDEARAWARSVIEAIQAEA